MTGFELLQKMELVDPDYIEKAERMPKNRSRSRLPWAIMAACLCLLVGAAFWLPALSRGTIPQPTPPTSIVPTTENTQSTQPTEQAEPWVVHYNEAKLSADAARDHGFCIFIEDLEPFAIIGLLPENPPAVTSASALFNSVGELLELTLQFSDATVRLSESEPFRCYMLPGERMPSEFNGVRFLACQYALGERIILNAEAQIRDIYFEFTLETEESGLEAAKARFQALLEAFTFYDEAPLDLSGIRPTQIPEFENRTLTPAEAADDPDFGAYLLQAIPEGFTTESLRRYRDQNSFFLSGLWTRGYDELCWKVSYYSEADAVRITSVADRENYDLSLYPIPRAESVPEELWEIVDDPIFLAEELTLEAVCARAYQVSDSGDSNGWRVQFTVKYGNVLVTVSAKGVEPQWLYEQLCLLPSPETEE